MAHTYTPKRRFGSQPEGQDLLDQCSLQSSVIPPTRIGFGCRCSRSKKSSCRASCPGPGRASYIRVSKVNMMSDSGELQNMQEAA